MIYLGNGIYSDSGPDVLMHGTPWKSHKYIAIKNGRYIYPEDPHRNVKIGMADKVKYYNSVTNQGPSAAEKAQTRRLHNGNVKSRAVNKGGKKYSNGEIDPFGMNKRRNSFKNKQDKAISKVKTKVKLERGPFGMFDENKKKKAKSKRLYKKLNLKKYLPKSRKLTKRPTAKQMREMFPRDEEYFKKTGMYRIKNPVSPFKW